ncbi:MAG: polyprenol monophosphomannose synthase [Actinomycetota bacterium]|nr:polyprenol monophosphomannose synthase [Actinomycetota bacterium]MDA2971485.1 polyprenol monophosphomannose synthase [Actinomycetota bacterium]MDA3000732.1 polyprenol monophosphomannose synthase [Actinomycetota bacterium]
MDDRDPVGEKMASVDVTDVRVVIPTYDEAENIEPLIGRIREVLPGVRVLVVDDASPDGTADVARRAGVEVLERVGKSGLGAAYRDGFAHALDSGAEIVVQMDADLSHDPDYLVEMLSAVRAGADAVIGSRYVPGGGCVDWPRLRRFLSRWGNRYAAGMLGLAVNDATSGYRAYSASILRRIDVPTVLADGYGFQVEMTHRLVRCGGRVVEIPIVFRDRQRGESKLSYRIIGEAFRLVTLLAIDDLRRGRRRHL